MPEQTDDATDLEEEHWARVGRLRESEAFEAFLASAGVAPIRSRSESLRITTEQQARDSIERLGALLERLRAEEGRAISPKRGMAFVRRTDVIAYVIAVRNRYLDRLETLRQQQIDSIEESVEAKVSDPELRRELSELVGQIRAQQQQQTTDIRAHDEAGELARLEIMARRWEVRKAMLEREPAAVLVGGILLVGLAAALIVAMFIHTPVPEILANGFLLILGFFFGQNSSRST
ncbi:hypothetical protein [Nocardia wallacei]|uniref:hypothetical protein n=1 Tax=Nocardia wallacei TaxID=480035 RepID=UPI002458A856|nr:hypothetical protein [Nocardia wallacei]